MLAITKSQSQFNFAQDFSQKSLSRHSATSMSGAFDPKESYNNSTLLQKLEAALPVSKSVKKPATNLNKIALETSLNLSEHLAYKFFNFLEQHVFNNFAKFCYTMADTTNGPQVFCLLAKLDEYNITTHQKMTEQYAKWKSMRQAELAKQKEMQKKIDWLSRKLDWTSQDLDQTYQQLVNLWEKYLVMQKELD